MDQNDVILKIDSRVNQGATVIFDFFVTTRDFQVLDISGPIPSLLVQQLTFHHCKWVRSRDLSRHR